MRHGKGFISVDATSLVTLTLAILLVVVVIRCLWKKGPQQPTALFKIYLNTSIVIGMGTICMAVSRTNELLYALFGMSMILWNFVSVFSAFWAPMRWSIYPYAYIIMFLLLLAYSATVGDFAHSPAQMATSISIFGIAVAVGAICTKGLIQKNAMAPVEHTDKPGHE